jgi:hypothetical protein
MKSVVCLILIQFALIRPSEAAQASDFLREQFKSSDIIYFGEFHTVAEDKEFLRTTLEDLMMDGTVDGFAFEFTRANQQQVFEQFLRDVSATPGSEKESEYLKQLNWSYSNMFNVKEYDAVMRLMKRIWVSKSGKVTFCAIDASGTNADTTDNGPKFQVLSNLPQTVQEEIKKLSGKSLQEIAKDSYAYDREASIGANVAQCAARSKKLIAYVGMGHAIRTERIMSSDWRTAARYTELAATGKTVKSLLLAQGYYDPFDPQTKQLPWFSETCLAQNRVTDFAAYSSASIPSQFDPCLTASSPDGLTKVSFGQAFDFVVVGPKGTKIKPSAERQWR